MKRLLICLVLMSGCCQLEERYVELDRQTYEVVGRDWLRYRRADLERAEREEDAHTVDDAREKLERAERLLRSWDARIREAEKGLEDSGE